MKRSALNYLSAIGKKGANMKQLVPMDNYGVFVDGKDTARANSLIVAEMFGKRHDNILKSIRAIIESGDDDGFNALNFKEIKYTDDRGRCKPAFDMTRDGFMLVAMGFTGTKAMQFKKAYISRFNEMEKFIRAVVTARKDFPLLTENIKLVHENPKPYHFSNECDMINRITTGLSTKQFRQLHNIPKGESIRPHLTQKQIDLLETLQKVDIGLMLAIPDYEQRKRQLEWYAMMRTAN